MMSHHLSAIAPQFPLIMCFRVQLPHAQLVCTLTNSCCISITDMLITPIVLADMTKPHG